MWYPREAKKLKGWMATLMVEYGRMIFGYIYAHSESAPKEQVEIYLNPEEWTWIVSSGDWTQTDGEVFDEAIKTVAPKVFRSLRPGEEYKEPRIEHEAEMGSPGGEWIHIRHDYFGDLEDDEEPGASA